MRWTTVAAAPAPADPGVADDRRFAGGAPGGRDQPARPVVEKARWIDVVPEYNPFKYNSFPANAGTQTFADHARAQQRAGASRPATGALERMPPVLAFQSVVDTTVSTPAVTYELLDRLPAAATSSCCST